MTRFEKIKNMSVADFFNMVVQREMTIDDVMLIYSFHNKGDGKSHCTNCIAKDCCKTINGGCFEAMKYALNEEMMENNETLKVCEHCLWAIESREGNLPTLVHHLDYDDTESQCDWCGETEIDKLYEILD